MSTMQSIMITKSSITNSYIALQPITYDFYLLYILATQQIDDSQQSVKSWIDFCKNSSLKCQVTSQLFIHKNHGYLEIFSVYDLINTDDLCLPASPKFTITAKNFMNFMAQKSHIDKTQPHQFFIVIDSKGHAHLTTDLTSMTKVSLLSSLQKKIAGLFTKPAQ